MFGTGRETRDYIHVDDVAQALYLLATTDTSDIIFNVANGEEITIREVTCMFAKSVGVDSDKITFNGIVREGDPLNWKADINRIKKLGYRQTVHMEDALYEYARWAEKRVKDHYWGR